MHDTRYRCIGEAVNRLEGQTMKEPLCLWTPLRESDVDDQHVRQHTSSNIRICS
jgi:hypothetical protein